jgi:MFS family permease
MKKKNKIFWFVLTIPIINSIAANTANYSASDVYNTGILRGIILAFFFIYFVLSLYPKDFPSTVILASIYYLLFLVPFSSNLFTSMVGVLKYSLGILMFPLGYYYFNTFDKFKSLVKILIISLIIYLIFILISNFFNLGKYDYAAGTFYFGSGSVNITKDIFILVLVAPISLLIFPERRKLLLIFYFIGFVVAIIGIKRSVLISGVLSIFVYLYLTRFRARQVKLILGGVVLFLIILFVFPVVYDTFQKRVTAREDQLSFEEKVIEKEARYNETTQVLNAWITGSLLFKLFGSEPFNDRFYYRSIRMLHTDYMVILSGTGAVGIFFWFYIYYAIFREKRKYAKLIYSNRLLIEINAIFTALIFVQLFMSVSSTVYAISLRGFIFLFWGASLALMRSVQIDNNKKTIEANKEIML